LSRFFNGAPCERLFFTFFNILLISLANQTPVFAADRPCHAASYDAYVAIKYVIDGDTVIRENGDRIRLIGLDTPEIGHDGSPDQDGAINARVYLDSLLKHHTTLAIVYDIERRDRHDRALTHLFLPDGTNVQALLLRDGLGTPLTIPPNLLFMQCYRQQALQASMARRGIWRLKQYQPVSVTELTGRERGYRIIEGQVTRIGKSPSSIWLNLENNTAIHIVPMDLQYFNEVDMKNIAGKTVRASGSLYRRNKELQMRLRHQIDLEILISPGAD